MGVCDDCPLKKECISSSSGRQKHLAVKVGAEPENLPRKMMQKIDDEQGRRIYEKRLAIVEPVFGNIRSQKKMDRFTLRGKPKVNGQWNLFCIVHNIEKILRFGKSFSMNLA